MVTLKDVAKKCGVSFSTVSKALKDSKEISSETIEMIKKTAEEMGYHPNIAARSLRTNRTYDIGVIFEDKTGAGLQHQYFAKILSGLQNSAQENNYEITFVSVSKSPNYDYLSHARARNFDGIAILSTEFSNPQIEKLIHSDIPTITLDYVYDNQHSAVISDNINGMTKLTEYIISQGHKKIALIHGEDTLVTRERKQVFTEICKNHNINIPAEYFIETLYHDSDKSEAATQKLLALPEPPTCIIYPDDYSALGGIKELNRQNIKPGKDISIAGYDGIMLTSIMVPPLTTYEQDGYKIGKTIAENLIAQIENKESFSPQKISISGKLLQGNTIAKI